jgi:hypothetical protein
MLFSKSSTPSKADAIWNYIESNQDENHCDQSLVRQFEIDQDTAQKAVIRWAMGDKKWFNEKFNGDGTNKA